MQTIIFNIFLFFIIAYFAWTFFKKKMATEYLPAIINNGAVIIDVRSTAEYKQNANPRSLNIPLDQIPQEIKKMDPKKTYILCCATGARSAQAFGVLKKNGFENVINAGPWTNTVLK